MLLGAISLDLFAVLFGGAVALLPSLAENRLGVDAVGLGWLRAATGIGATIVTVALSIRPVRRHIGRNLFLVVALFGAFTVVLGLTRNFAGRVRQPDAARARPTRSASSSGRRWSRW